MKAPKRIGDRQVERVIGALLRAGVIAAAVVVLAGGILYLARHGRDAPRYRSFQGEPVFLTHVDGVLKEALALRSEAIIQLGLLLLIAVPIVRVAVSLIAYLLERDWLYVGVTALVLAVLAFSLLGGVL
ncbi:MAG TPA: DUF1634 domain-containing protein [Spirochaetia bacterium]|nr:DUF1634 domain-containing protein [Spirochaetia bacterium]